MSATQSRSGAGRRGLRRLSSPGLKLRSAKGFRCRVVGKVYGRSAELLLFLLTLTLTALSHSNAFALSSSLRPGSFPLICAALILGLSSLNISILHSLPP